MVFHGLQKLTLLDYPGKVACTVFTGGCNFRCPFCHNAVLVVRPGEAETFSEEELLSFFSRRRGVLDGVCVTGGEPLMDPGIIGFLGKVRETGLSVKLDTNGSYPERLREIIGAGLVDYIAMDVKNSPEKYAATAGICDFDISAAEKSRDLIMSCGIEYEFRTTVVRQFHETSDIVKAAKWISGAEKYFLQNFVDSGDVITDGLSAWPREKLLEMRDAAAPFVKFAGLRGV